MSEVDVLVVGCRIAGSLTALRLAARGVTVRVLESRDFPSETLSTHFFRGGGLVRSLEEVGVLDEVLSSGAPPMACEYFSVDGGIVEQGPPQDPGDIGYSLSVRRLVLDAVLARRVVATVDARMRTKVIDLVVRNGSVVGVVDDHGEHHLARVVVGADGRRSTLARLVRAASVERAPAARALYYRYVTGWRSPDAVGPEFALDGDAFLYAFPSDEGLTCLAVSVPTNDHAQAGRDPGARLQHAFHQNPRTTDRLQHVEWVSRVFVGQPADSVWRAAYGPGWALVGDAATCQDPWAGLGMDTAARQAEAFAEAFTTSPETWGTVYESLRHERTHEGYAQTTRLAPDLRQLIG